MALRILAAQVVVAALVTVETGRWWAYPVLWLAPWMTVWRVINRLRSIAEHGGMARSRDRRETTHVVRQTWPARFWIVPFNTGWHLAHHVDMGVPFRNLPRLHDELVASGWVTPEHHLPELPGPVEGPGVGLNPRRARAVSLDVPPLAGTLRCTCILWTAHGRPAPPTGRDAGRDPAAGGAAAGLSGCGTAEAERGHRQGTASPPATATTTPPRGPRAPARRARGRDPATVYV